MVDVSRHTVLKVVESHHNPPFVGRRLRFLSEKTETLNCLKQ
ncbi:MAG: hypothetical protein ACOYCB_09255 [Fastidiosipilaceae bacterium]